MSDIMITGKEFEEKVIKSDKPVLIDFFATWCGPCKMMSPIVEQIAEELEDKVNVYKIDTDKDQELAYKYEIMSIPTFLIFKDGKLVNKLVGMRDKEELMKELKNQKN